MSSRRVGAALAAAVFAADRASKLWIRERFSLFDSWTAVPGLLDIVHTENPGMAFGLLADHASPWRTFLLIGVSLAILVVLARLLWQAGAGERGQAAALGLVMGGASGNLWDRLLRGRVTDFIDVHAGEFHWPTFNLADSAITVGAILLAADLWRQRQPGAAKSGRGGR